MLLSFASTPPPLLPWTLFPDLETDHSLRFNQNMAGFFIFNPLTSLFLLLLPIPTPQALSFSFRNFTTNARNISLFGDASLVNKDSSVTWSSGGVVFNKPIKLVRGTTPKTKVSFSTSFTFSISPILGDSLAFLMIPANSLSHLLNWRSFNVLSVEFGRNCTDRSGVDADNIIWVGLENVPSTDLGVLQSWVDYQAGSNRLEIRLNRSGYSKPRNPLASYEMDLSGFWRNVFVGFGSSNRNLSRIYKIFSWSFELRFAPSWLHSRPLDPGRGSNLGRKRTRCVSGLVAALFVGAGFGGSLSFLVVFLWHVVNGDRRPVVPERGADALPEFEYEKREAVGMETKGCVN